MVGTKAARVLVTAVVLSGGLAACGHGAKSASPPSPSPMDSLQGKWQLVNSEHADAGRYLRGPYELGVEASNTGATWTVTGPRGGPCGGAASGSIEGTGSKPISVHVKPVAHVECNVGATGTLPLPVGIDLVHATSYVLGQANGETSLTFYDSRNRPVSVWVGPGVK